MVWFYTEALNSFAQVSYRLTVVSYSWDSCSLPQTGVQPCLQAFPWRRPSCQTEWLQQRTDQILWCTVCGELLSPFHDFRTSHTSSGRSSLHNCFHLSHQWKVHSSLLPASSCQARLGAIEWMFGSPKIHVLRHLIITTNPAAYEQRLFLAQATCLQWVSWSSVFYCLYS